MSKSVNSLIIIGERPSLIFFRKIGPLATIDVTHGALRVLSDDVRLQSSIQRSVEGLISERALILERHTVQRSAEGWSHFAGFAPATPKQAGFLAALAQVFLVRPDEKIGGVTVRWSQTTLS